MDSIRLHTGEIVSGERYRVARDKVADWYESHARKMRASCPYAAHVTEAEKDDILAKNLAHAAELRAGAPYGFSVWQRINMELTGECVALLPKPAA